MTTFAVLATGNHFVLDIVGGRWSRWRSFAIVQLASRAGRRRARSPD